MYIKTSDQEKLNLGIGNYTCNWGMHIAGLYENEKERDEIIFGFLKQGYLEGDFQLYCPVERTEQNFRQEFTAQCPGCDNSLKQNKDFSILSAKDLYYPDGTFSPRAMDKGLNKFFVLSQQNGKRNIRATAEMVWALEAIPGTEYLMAYEARLNFFIPGKPWISICMYNINKFSGSVIMEVLKTHPYTLNGGILTQNPYFVEPAQWLRDNAPEYLD